MYKKWVGGEAASGDVALGLATPNLAGKRASSSKHHFVTPQTYKHYFCDTTNLPNQKMPLRIIGRVITIRAISNITMSISREQADHYIRSFISKTSTTTTCTTTAPHHTIPHHTTTSNHRNGTDPNTTHDIWGMEVSTNRGS